MEFTDYSFFFETKELIACISHRDYNYSNSIYRKEFVSSLYLRDKLIVAPNQTHSNNVAIATKSSNNYNNIDGLISLNNDLVLTLLVADCIPLFIFNNKSNNFALVHSGWRGTVNNIAANSINLMKKNGNCLKDLKFVIGPSIGACCYEVGRDVFESFDSNYYQIINEKKANLNLSNIICDQIIDFGISNKNIFIDQDCTFCKNKKYFSYRKEGDISGRMVAVMGLK